MSFKLGMVHGSKGTALQQNSHRMQSTLYSERLDPRSLSTDPCSRTMLLQDLGLLWILDPQDFRSPASH